MGDYRQTGVCDAAFMDVEHKLRILDHIHPEAQGKAADMDKGTENARKRRLEFSANDLTSILVSFRSLHIDLLN